MFTSLQSKKLDNPLIIKNLIWIRKRMSDDNVILQCLILSHSGIKGNEQVNKAARSTLSMVPEKK